MNRPLEGKGKRKDERGQRNITGKGPGGTGLGKASVAEWKEARRSVGWDEMGDGRKDQCETLYAIMPGQQKSLEELREFRFMLWEYLWLFFGDELRGGGCRRDMSRPFGVFGTVWWSKGSQQHLQENKAWSHLPQINLGSTSMVWDADQITWPCSLPLS